MNNSFFFPCYKLQVEQFHLNFTGSESLLGTPVFLNPADGCPVWRIYLHCLESTSCFSGCGMARYTLGRMPTGLGVIRFRKFISICNPSFNNRVFFKSNSSVIDIVIRAFNESPKRVQSSCSLHVFNCLFYIFFVITNYIFLFL